MNPFELLSVRIQTPSFLDSFISYYFIFIYILKIIPLKALL